MSLLKEHYHHLDLSRTSEVTSPAEILNIYTREFITEKSFTFANFVTMVLNAIRDYLENKITEETLSALLHATYVSGITKTFHEEPYLLKHNSLLALVSELTDIMWLKNSENFPTYKNKLKQDWTEFVAYYENYFNKK